MLPATAPSALPFLGAHFVLAVDGLTSVSFSKCSGLAADVGVEEYLEGGENRFAHRLPSRASFPNLVLTQGAGPSTELWSWFSEYLVRGAVDPRDGQVSLMSTVEGDLVPVRVWGFRRGWPVKLTGPDLDAQSVAVAVESVEIAHHGLHLTKVEV
jgi:phage tail-like protein